MRYTTSSTLGGSDQRFASRYSGTATRNLYPNGSAQSEYRVFLCSHWQTAV